MNGDVLPRELLPEKVLLKSVRLLFVPKTKKHAGFKMNPRVKLHFINKLKTK